MLRFWYVIIISLPYIIYYLAKGSYIEKNAERYSEADRYRVALRVIHVMKRNGRIRTSVTGMENLPAEGGYVLYANHQGKYDALGIMLAHPKPCAMLWEEKSADRLVARQVCGLVEGTTISFEDPKQQIGALKTIAERVKEGKPYLIFPEGGYTDNKNELQEFKSGCFACSLKSKTPIVPVVIYDSWRSMDTNTFERVRTQVHFLPQIPYEEYGKLRKPDVCELVKKRIQEKLDELKEADPRR